MATITPELLLGIYEDVALLQSQVAELQAQMITAQSSIANLQPTDTGWVDLPLSEGILAYNDEQTPRCRKIGNIVFLSGVFKGVVANNTPVGTLPEGFRPSKKIMFAVPSVAQCMSRISITTNGVITHERATNEPLVATNWHSIACTFNVD